MTIADKARRAIGSFWSEVGRLGVAYFFSEALGKGGVYLIILWLATVMPVSEFGLLSLLIALLTLFSVCAGLGLPDAIVRQHILQEASDAARSLAIGLPPLVTLGTLFVAALAAPSLAAFLATPAPLPLLAIAGGGVLALRQAWLASLRARRTSMHYLTSRVAEPVVFAVCTLAIVVTSGASFFNTALAYIASVSTVAVLGVTRLTSGVRLRWPTAVAGNILAFSLPLVPHSLAMTGLALLDQVIIQQQLGAEATGLYAFAYRVGMLMSLVVFGFSAAWGPWVLQRLSSGDREALRSTARVASRVGLIAAMTLSWALPPVAGWLAPAAYNSALWLIPLVIYGNLWFGLYTLLAGHYVFGARTSALAFASSCALIFNVVANYLLIPIFGIGAAAVTTVVSYMLLTTITLVLEVQGGRELGFHRCVAEAALATPIILAPMLFLR